MTTADAKAIRAILDQPWGNEDEAGWRLSVRAMTPDEANNAQIEWQERQHIIEGALPSWRDAAEAVAGGDIEDIKTHLDCLSAIDHGSEGDWFARLERLSSNVLDRVTQLFSHSDDDDDDEEVVLLPTPDLVNGEAVAAVAHRMVSSIRPHLEEFVRRSSPPTAHTRVSKQVAEFSEVSMEVAVLYEMLDIANNRCEAILEALDDRVADGTDDEDDEDEEEEEEEEEDEDEEEADDE